MGGIQGPYLGLVWLLCEPQVAYTGGRLPKAFASTKLGPACGKTTLCQGKSSTGEVAAAAAAVWCVRTSEQEVK